MQGDALHSVHKGSSTAAAAQQSTAELQGGIQHGCKPQHFTWPSRLYFLAGNGAVVGADLRCSSSSVGGGAAPQQAQRVLLQDPTPVSGLSWEHPVLGISFQRGPLALLDAEAAMGQGLSASSGGSSAAGASTAAARGGARRRSGGSSSSSDAAPAAPWLRWLSAVGGGEPAASCLALADQWLAAGYESGIVATWDFRRALEAERAAAALRQRKQQRRAAAREAGGKRGGARGRRGGGEGCATEQG